MSCWIEVKELNLPIGTEWTRSSYPADGVYLVNGQVMVASSTSVVSIYGAHQFIIANKPKELSEERTVNESFALRMLAIAVKGNHELVSMP